MIPVPPNRRLRKYGLTREQFIALWDLCGGRCPLCSKKFGRGRPVCIDHDHKTFEVRGLLCWSCNGELGTLNDNLSWLEAAARYLRVPPTKQLWTHAPRVENAPPVMEER